MKYVTLLLCVEALTCIVACMKVNMQGSLSLGKDVIDSLSYYLGTNVMNNRRSLMPAPIEDPITSAVRTALLCKNLDFCQDELQHFVNEYIVILAKAVESVINSSLPEFSTEKYEEHLVHKIEIIRKILEDANVRAGGNEVYYWIQAIKRINAIFQQTLDLFIPDIKSDPTNDKYNAKTILNQKLVIATAFIERKYEIKLCAEHDYCLNSYECTQALNKILFNFKTLPEDRIRIFLRYVYESLFNSDFYNHFSQSSANEFQIVLNDMVYVNDTPTRDVMASVQKTVEARLNIIKMNKGLQVAHDILLAHAILSDVDHMFSNRTDPFQMFLNHFYDWLASDIPIAKHIRAVMLDISKEIWMHEEDLVLKLINEVQVFLILTVGPEK